MFILSSSLLCKFAAAGTFCSVAAGGGVAAYFYKDEIFGTRKNEYVFVAVKKDGSVTQTSGISEFTTTSGDKTTKNYKCKYTVGNQDHYDNNCTVIKWNQESITNALNDRHSTLLKKEIKTSEEIKTQQTALLRISKKLYQYINTTGNTQNISIVNKTTPTQIYGGFTRIFDVDRDYTNPLASTKSNLFLMRITEPTGSASISTDSTKSFKCKIGDATTATDCKIYKASNKNETNNLDSVNSVELVAFTDSDKTSGKYVVVELIGEEKTVEQLKNKSVAIHVITNTADTLSDSNKLLTATVDQILFKQTTGTQVKAFPLSPRFVSYLVKKTTESSTSFSDIATDTNKNYKCQFTSGANTNEDFSCLVQTLPTLTSSAKIHTYASISKPSTNLTGVSSSTISQEHFVLTVDANKLFNLRPNWTTPATVVAVKATNTTDASKTVSFELLQEVTDNQATGTTNLALVKYKTTETSATGWTLGTGKCAFAKTDTTGFDCSFKTATLSNGNNIENADISQTDATWTTDPAANSYYALQLTSPKNIADFDGKTLFYHTSTENKKITFEIVALMGGDIASSKTHYFLEASRLLPKTGA